REKLRLPSAGSPNPEMVAGGLPPAQPLPSAATAAIGLAVRTQTSDRRADDVPSPPHITMRRMESSHTRCMPARGGWGSGMSVTDVHADPFQENVVFV